jgi:hypothetical protein
MTNLFKDGKVPEGLSPDTQKKHPAPQPEPSGSAAAANGTNGSRNHAADATTVVYARNGQRTITPPASIVNEMAGWFPSTSRASRRRSCAALPA